MEATATSDREILRAGPLEIRINDQIALAEGHALTLTRHELSLLISLVQRRGAVVSREDLSQRAWSRPLSDGDRSVDVYVRRLRAKLGRAAPNWEFIHTHFAFGYRLDPERMAE